MPFPEGDQLPDRCPWPAPRLPEAPLRPYLQGCACSLQELLWAVLLRSKLAQLPNHSLQAFSVVGHLPSEGP